ncbi:DUF7782 domain-containing protein [Jatrophihabitans sp. DSM 45814]
MQPLFGPRFVDAMRQAMGEAYTDQAVSDALGLAGQAAMARGDLSGAERLTRGGSASEIWIRLFLLGLDVESTVAAKALSPVDLGEAVESGLLIARAGTVRAGLDVRPYSESGGPNWWVVSDLGSDVRPGVVAGEHVLGIGSAATTLAQSTMRRPVERALDIGTGCGVQALHLSRHAKSIVATDINPRALRMAATTAALNGLTWDLRTGSLLAPVGEQSFDLIVCNPPFIVGPGFSAADEGYTYRDSGMAGDEVCRELVEGLPDRLRPGGSAQMLANWVITADERWQDRLDAWLAHADCDAWIWQREVADPGEYVSMWLRDAGLQPGSQAWRSRYDRWADWFVTNGVLAVGMGLVNLHRTGATPRVVLAEDVVQPIEQPIGAAIAQWFDRQSWLRREGQTGLLDACLRTAEDVVYEQRSMLAKSMLTQDGPAQGEAATDDGSLKQLRQLRSMRWEVEIDSAVLGLVSTCTGEIPLGSGMVLIADLLGLEAVEVVTALTPVVADLVQRGFLLPPDGSIPQHRA